MRNGNVSTFLLTASLAIIIAAAQDPGWAIAQLEDLTSRVSNLEETLANLVSTVVTLREDGNKIKKLTVASLNIALASEDEQCQKAQELVEVIGTLAFFIGMGPHTCELMGTAMYPAVSCNQLLAACHKQSSGSYFIQGNIFAQVYCDMTSFDGGWTRYGKGGMSSVWNFRDEDEEEVTINLISPGEIKMIKDLNFNTFRVYTDVEFLLVAEESTNPSTLDVRSLPWLEPKTITIGHGGNHTHLELTNEGDRLACYARPEGNRGSRCGEGHLPRTDEPSQRMVFASVYFGPRAVDRGAATWSGDDDGDWSRNRYSWSGSYYYLLAK